MFPEGERSTQLSAEVLDQEYPGLRLAVSQAVKVIVDYVTPFRPETDSLRPPVLLCDGQALSDFLRRPLSYSPDERLVEGTPFNYFLALQGVIVSDRDRIKLKLSQPNGYRDIVRSMAEEILHAMTTFSEGEATRLGFIHLDEPRDFHNLSPGEIYYYELEAPDEVNQEEPSFMGEAMEYRLTENITDLAIRSLMGKLVPELEEFARSLICVWDQTQRPIQFLVDDSARAAWLEALMTADLGPIEKRFDPRIVEVIKQPNLTVLNARFPLKDPKTDVVFV